MPVIKTILGFRQYPSSLVWNARAKESNRLTQTLASLQITEVTLSDMIATVNDYNQQMSKNTKYLSTQRVKHAALCPRYTIGNGAPDCTNLPNNN